MEVSRFINIFKEHTYSAYCLVVWKDYLWSGSGATIQQWNASGHCINTLEGHDCEVLCLLGWKDFLYSLDRSGTIRVWNLEGECVRVIQGIQRTLLQALAIWKDSLVRCCIDSVQICNEDGQCMHEWEVIGA